MSGTKVQREDCQSLEIPCVHDPGNFALSDDFTGKVYFNCPCLHVYTNETFLQIHIAITP